MTPDVGSLRAALDEWREACDGLSGAGLAKEDRWSRASRALRAALAAEPVTPEPWDDEIDPVEEVAAEEGISVAAAERQLGVDRLAPSEREAQIERIAAALRAAENAWAKFVLTNPAKVPPGARWPERERWIAEWLVENDAGLRAALRSQESQTGASE